MEATGCSFCVILGHRNQKFSSAGQWLASSPKCGRVPRVWEDGQAFIQKAVGVEWSFFDVKNGCFCCFKEATGTSFATRTGIDKAVE
jgi:hypothetical protein